MKIVACTLCGTMFAFHGLKYDVHGVLYNKNDDKVPCSARPDGYRCGGELKRVELDMGNGDVLLLGNA